MKLIILTSKKEELRDMIVEMKSIPKAIHRAVKYYNLAIVELVGFSTIHANVKKKNIYIKIF
jgi:hypothetical protein